MIGSWHTAAGQAPFASADLRQAVRKIRDEAPPPLERADLPPGFERVLRTALSKRPEDRPASALAFAESLREVQARAGHLQTPIKLERAPGEALAPPPSLPRPDPSPASQPVQAAPAGAVVGAINDPTSGHTIARREAPKAAPPPVAPTTPVRRRLIAAAAVVVAVLVVVGILVSNDSDGETSATSNQPTTVPPVDSFLDIVQPPSGVTIEPVADGYSVTIPAVDGASSFIVTPVGGAGNAVPPEAVSVAAADMPLVLTGDSATGCVVVQAVGTSGRVSRQAGPFCAQQS